MAEQQDFQIDWDTALEGFGEYEPIPAGPYVMEIIEALSTKASTGSPMVVTKLKVIGGPYDGKVVMNNLVAKPGSENSQKMFLVHLVAFGLPKEWLDQRPGGIAIAQALVGRRANVEVSIKELDKGPSNNVEKIKRLVSDVPGAPAVAAGPTPPGPAPAPAPAAAPAPGVPPSIPSTTPPPIPPPPSAPPPVAPTGASEVPATALDGDPF